METYFSNDDGIFAVGKAAKYCRESNILGKQNSFGFIFELFGLNDLEIIPVKKICNKTVILNEENQVFVSSIREGFEHN